MTDHDDVFVHERALVETDVFVGPQATFTNDLMPRSRQPFELSETMVQRGASIGAGAVILAGVTIGERAMVGAGAVVTKDVPRTPSWSGIRRG
jgi:UDP-2-acetamido-3-amino-2,3-dideoxy-glucuronate N-acetyltransferase